MPKTNSLIKPRTDLRTPPMFKVIYLNDDKTTVQFVIESLGEYFNYSLPTAEKIANTVHTTGSAVVAILPFQIAEQKGIEVTTAARAAVFPLQVKIERSIDN